MALSTVINRRTGKDVVAAAQVSDVRISQDGTVRLAVALSAQDDPAIVRDVRQAVARVAGGNDVAIDIEDPAQRAGGAQRALPVMDDRPAAPRASVPAPEKYPHLGRIVAVSSGKGGVGKSTVAVNVAVSLAQQGLRVGLMDADVYGPNLPRMLGLDGAPLVEREKIVPHRAYGVKAISLGLLIERDQPAIWRGPIVMKIVTQFLRDVAWGTLDYLIVDMPPGTGDAQLSLVQATQVSTALIVTTPQLVSTGDALRGAKMFMRVGVPVLGVVENMSWFECPHCGKPSAIFGAGGGQQLAEELELPLLAQIPLYPPLLKGGDEGRPVVAVDGASSAARALAALANAVHESLGAPAGR